jgi:hypothetical protein
MVSQVQIVAIMMLINGGLACLMGGLLVAVGPLMWSMLSMDPGRPKGPGEEKLITAISIIYVVAGIVVLLGGVMSIVGGIRGLKFRNRGLVLAALFCNILPVFSCYCAPTSIGLMIYGLIVMFQSDVAEAFRMAESGVPAEEIRYRFYQRKLRQAFPDRPDRDDDGWRDQPRDEPRRPPPAEGAGDQGIFEK